MRGEWDDIVEELGPALFRYFRASFVVQTAEDLTQVTILRLVEKTRAGRFDPALGTLRMYAFGIAHFVRLEQLRAREGAGGEVDVPAEVTGAHERLERADQVARLGAAIAELPEAQRQVVSLYLDRELTTVEIGRILGIPENTVKSHVRRAKDSLRARLGGV